MFEYLVSNSQQIILIAIIYIVIGFCLAWFSSSMYSRVIRKYQIAGESDIIKELPKSYLYMVMFFWLPNIIVSTLVILFVGFSNLRFSLLERIATYKQTHFSKK